MILNIPIGVAPRIMGIGPVFAIPAALKNCGLSVEAKINEARDKVGFVAGHIKAL